MANVVGTVVQSKRQREERNKTAHFTSVLSLPVPTPTFPRVSLQQKTLQQDFVLPSVKTTSSSVLYMQQKLQKISRLLPSASRISHSWELRDQRQQWRNILFLSYFISALLIFFPLHIGPLLLEVLMTSCSRSTSLSGSRNLLAREIYKQHCKEMLLSISEQAMRINKVIPSPHSLNLPEKGELRQL